MIQIAIKNHIKIMLIHKSNFVIGIISQLVFSLLSIIFLILLVNNKPIVGWSRTDIILLMGYMDIVFGLMNVILFKLYFVYSPLYIIGGGLDLVKTKPANPFIYLIIRNLNLEGIIIILKGVIIVLLTIILGGYVITLKKLLFSLITLPFALFSYLGILMFVTAFSAFFPKRKSFTDPILSLQIFSQYPLPVYPTYIQIFLTITVPLALVNYHPVRLILEKSDSLFNFTFFGYALFTLFVFLIGLVTFNLSIRKYRSSGT